MAAPRMLAFQDAIDHVRDFLKADASEATQRACRRAVLSAYSILAQVRDWNYYKTQYTLTTSAPYSTGTVAVTASTRVVTLSSGTWPTWAAQGTIRIGSANYQVYSRDSGTQVTLEAANAPASNVASGTSYTIYQNQYRLPSDCRRIFRPENEGVWYESQYITPQKWNQLDRLRSYSGNQRWFTILSDPNNLGGYVLCFWPYPSSALTIEFLYQRYAAPLVYTGYETASNVGTVASTSGSATITGTSTTFASAMAGAFIRFSSVAPATPLALGGEADLNPYTEQKVIATYSSATSIATDSTMSNTLSGVGYRVTSPVDIAPHMIEAFLRCCEWQVGIYRQLGDRQISERDYRSALMLALEGDALFEMERSAYNAYEPGSASYTVTPP